MEGNKLDVVCQAQPSLQRLAKHAQSASAFGTDQIGQFLTTEN
jgi:hypothetical protein